MSTGKTALQVTEEYYYLLYWDAQLITPYSAPVASQGIQDGLIYEYIKKKRWGSLKKKECSPKKGFPTTWAPSFGYTFTRGLHLISGDSLRKLAAKYAIQKLSTFKKKKKKGWALSAWKHHATFPCFPSPQTHTLKTQWDSVFHSMSWTLLLIGLACSVTLLGEFATTKDLSQQGLGLQREVIANGSSTNKQLGNPSPSFSLSQTSLSKSLTLSPHIRG